MSIIIPFTYNWLIKRALKGSNVKTILELGCGKGAFADLVNDRNEYEIVGIDIYNPSLEICRKKGKYKKLIKADLSKRLEFRSSSFDVVVCLQTIEHLKKSNGKTLLSEIEKMAKKLIIITTPVGVCAQEEYDGNKYQHHLSSWLPEDFRSRGYKVSGVGLKVVYGSHSHVHQDTKIYNLPLYFFSFLMNPVTNKMAELGCQMVAVKTVLR